MEKKIVVANWKMNPKTLGQARKILHSLAGQKAIIRRIRLIICPPIIFIPYLFSEIKNIGADCGAQNVSEHEAGTCTGEIAASMLQSVGISYSIIGHSERRKMGETDEIIRDKAKQLLKQKIVPIIAMGESEQGENAHTVLNEQIKKICSGILRKDIKKTILAYEPRWAISNGVTDTVGSGDTPEHAIEKLIYMRRMVAHMYGAENAKKTPIVYGGSVRARNIEGFIKKEIGFDGVLVGGASLDAQELIRLIQKIV